MKFEEALKELQEITDTLGKDQDDLDLDVALEKYKRGRELVKLCREKLGEFEKELEKLNEEG